MNKLLFLVCLLLLGFVTWREKATVQEWKAKARSILHRKLFPDYESEQHPTIPTHSNASNSSLTSRSLPAATPSSTPVPTPDSLSAPPNDAHKDYFKHLVMIEGDQGRGSGFIAMLFERPLLFTNTHVLGGNSKISARLLSGQKIALQESFAVAESYDVSVFQQDTAKDGLPILKDLESNVSIGDDVFVLGNSLGAGVVTELQGQVTGLGPELVEVDARFVAGNSGSPVVHAKTGRVIGIATFSIMRQMDGFGRDSRFNSVERRFAYRLDNVPAWRNTNWQTFTKESRILNTIATRTDDVWNLAIDISKNGRVTDWNQHLRRDNYLALTAGIWQKALASAVSRGTESNAALLSEKQRFINGVLTALTIDLSFLKPETFTAYHKREFEEQVRYREFLKSYFGFMRQQLSNDPQFLSR